MRTNMGFDLPKAGDKILSREGDLAGEATGGRYPCQLEGCNGLRIVTRWPDGKITRPCTRGMSPVSLSGDVWKIE